MKPSFLAPAVLATVFLAACSKTPEPAPPPPLPAPTVTIGSAAGQYKLDPYHSNLSFKVMHLGLAPYVARFTKVDATLDLDPANLAASKVSATIDPASVRTDFSGDYAATHKGSPYKTFDEALAKDVKFFNAAQFAQITFQSTGVKVTGNNRMQITGDLTLLGKTQPVTLDATVTGSMAQHPWTKAGAVGFSATGTFKRAPFGMDQLLQFVSDDVTIEFNGEFHQPPSAPAS